MNTAATECSFLLNFSLISLPSEHQKLLVKLCFKKQKQGPMMYEEKKQQMRKSKTDNHNLGAQNTAR